MRNKAKLISATLLLSMFLVGMSSLSPRAYGAATAPCIPTPASCGIKILSPGGGLNTNTTVLRSFVVSFFVFNFTLVQPGRCASCDVNTVSGTGASAFNEGHIHVWVDGHYVTIWASPNGIPLTLSKGTHTIRLDLVNDFHQTFSPGINATTTVNVVDPVNDAIQSTASNTQSIASNAQNYGLGALIVSVIVLILVAYVAFKPKPKTT